MFEFEEKALYICTRSLVSRKLIPKGKSAGKFGVILQFDFWVTVMFVIQN